jgi:hypothetical protein
MKARPLQEFVIEQIRKAGGTARVCTSVDEIEELLFEQQDVWERGHFVAIELKFDKRIPWYRNESDLKSKCMRMIRNKFPSAWVYKTSDRWVSGIPDLIICLG